MTTTRSGCQGCDFKGHSQGLQTYCRLVGRMVQLNRTMDVPFRDCAYRTWADWFGAELVDEARRARAAAAMQQEKAA